jgi:hypothetical protein
VKPVVPPTAAIGVVHGVYCSEPPLTESSALVNVCGVPTAIRNGLTPT